jgi:hypothetical protein
MGLLDDAIREHLELKRRHGAPEGEVDRLTDEVFGSNAPPPADAVPAEPEPVALPEEPAPEPEPEQPPALDEAPLPVVEVPPPSFTDSEPWLDDPDEVPAEESLDHQRTEEHPAPSLSDEYVEPDEGPEGEDVLEETPEFLQETPEHDRLWFEQKPPRDFDLGSG